MYENKGRNLYFYIGSAEIKRDWLIFAHVTLDGIIFSRYEYQKQNGGAQLHSENIETIRKTKSFPSRKDIKLVYNVKFQKCLFCLLRD